MRIAPVTFHRNTAPSFKGIMHKTAEYASSQDGDWYDNIFYHYYPFKDESKEEVQKELTEFQRMFSDSDYTLTKVTTKPSLSITKQQYENLIQAGVSKDTIIETLGQDEEKK